MRTSLFLFLMALAAPTWADVSDSGNLSINGQGLIVGTMTVSGNSFSVGGSTFVVTASSVGILTTSPRATLDVNGSAQFGSGAAKSTFTAAGLLTLPAAGIQWADGSTSTTAASGGGGGSATYASTRTINIPQVTFTNTSFSGCNITGSTVTATTGANTLVIMVTGNIAGNAANTELMLIALLDGQCVSGSACNPIVSAAEVASMDNVNVGFAWNAGSVSAGSHSVCIGAWNGAAQTSKWWGPNSAISGDPASSNQVSFKEMP